MAKGFIQILCEKYRLTQKQLANELGIPVRTIENWAYRNDSCPIYMKCLIEEHFEHKLFMSVALEEDAEFVERIADLASEQERHYLERME